MNEVSAKEVQLWVWVWGGSTLTLAGVAVIAQGGNPLAESSVAMQVPSSASDMLIFRNNSEGNSKNCYNTKEVIKREY